MDTYAQRVAEAAVVLRDARWVAAFTGAGISTESGISDFRSPGGVWDRYRVVMYDEFLASADARREYWSMKRELFRELSCARPNAAHMALAELEAMGRLGCLITQNIDGLHQDAGSSPEIVVELHGTNRLAGCLSCGARWPMEEIQPRLVAGDLDPHCESCGGLVKPCTISFGQSMPEQEVQRAIDAAQACDAMLMAGSSLQVQPAAGIPPIARQGGAKLIYVNRTQTPTDHMADVIFREDAGRVLGDVMRELRGAAQG